jgi:nucleoside-diphosphate kinase
MPTEQTLILLKPDAIERGLVGTIISRIEATDLTISQLTTVDPDQELLADHYEEHQDEDFYEDLLDYMDDTIIAGTVEGPAAVATVRKLLGDTEPATAPPGTIRGDLSHDSYERADEEERAVHNLIHASASLKEATQEIALWFSAAS